MTNGRRPGCAALRSDVPLASSSGTGCYRAVHVADGVDAPRQRSADELAGGDRAAHVADVVGPQGNQLTSLPSEIGQLTSLKQLDLHDNQLTSLPAEIGQLTSLKWLHLSYNQLTSLPAEVGQLASLTELGLSYNPLTSLPAEIGQLTSLSELWPQPQSADERAGGDLAAHVAEVVGLSGQSS